jgi:DNA-binding transcriptional regulator/RsmH inhibitor MraZ
VSGTLASGRPADIDMKSIINLAMEKGAFTVKKSLSGLASSEFEEIKVMENMSMDEIERKLAAVPSTLPARARFFDRVNYYGQAAELDKQGRVLIHPRLREAADMSGEVDVFGLYDYLEVWNHDRFIAKLQREPYTDNDASVLAQYGI